MRFCFNQRFRLGLHGLERFNRCFSGKGLKFLMMRILQIKMICGGTPPEERTLDLSGSGVLSSGAFGSGAALLEALCLALYGRGVPRPVGTPSPLDSEEGEKEECEVEAVFEAGDEGGRPVRYRAACTLSRGGEGVVPARRTLRRIEEGTKERDASGPIEEVTGLSFEAFLRSALLRRDAFSALLRTEPETRAPMLDVLFGDGLYPRTESLAYEKFRAEKAERTARGEARSPTPAAGETEDLRRELSSVLRELADRGRERPRSVSAPSEGEGLAQAERDLQDLDRRRAEWEKEMALFAPDRRRLDQARQALELGDAYHTLSLMRKEQERDRLEQLSLSADMNRCRDEAQTAEEAFCLAEVTLRDRIVAQKRLTDTVRTVRELDQQSQERQNAVKEARAQLQALETRLSAVSVRAEQEQAALEKTGVSLREARKYLQINAADEKLAPALEGIRKCFGLFSRSQENRQALRESYDNALRRRQDAQNTLNDRQAMFSDITHRFGIVEKNFERAQAFFGASLKGKPMEEWREICTVGERRIQEMDRLAANLNREREIQEEVRQLLDRRLKMENERRELGIKETERAARIERAQAALRPLEKRLEMLRRVDALDEDMRTFLQDGSPCPLCGSLTHPYAGGLFPDSGAARQQLLDARQELDALKEEAAARQTQAAGLEEKILSAARDEEELQRELALLNDAITEGVASLGLKLGVGVSPLEELARVRQRTRDQMQRAYDVLTAAEQAERELMAAKDALERIRGSQEELTRYHQEALSGLKQSQGEAERLEKEIRSHEESFNSVRRELIGQVSLFGYKTLPDDNPGQLLELLTTRSAAWERRAEEKERLERALCTEQASLLALQKEKDGLRAEAVGKLDLVKHLETERDALQQQRIVLFASKDPETEERRMEESVRELRSQLELRREARNESRARLDGIMIRLHDLETVQATRRELLQREEIAFGKSLLAKGFRSEDDYLSACLPEEERRALQERMRELSRTGFEIGASQDDARFAQEELRSRSLSAAGRPLKGLADLMERAGALYLELGPDDEGERLYREYGDALRRRVPADAAGRGEPDAALRAYARDLAFESVLRRANDLLSRGQTSLRILREEKGAGKSFGLILKGDAAGELPEREARIASLALAWGLCDLFRREGGGANLRVLDRHPNGEDAEEAALMDALCEEGECVCP